MEINVRNDSSVDFDSVRVVFPGGTVDYGAVPAGRESGYEVVQQAYRYAYVEAHAGARRYVLQPIDYTGEKLLEGGRYTYALNLRDEELTLELVRH